MKQICSILLIAACALTLALAQKSGNAFLGRWDLTITPNNGASYPDWMEVAVKDGTLTTRIQPRSGSAFYAKESKLESGHLKVNANGGNTWDMTIEGDKLAGVIQRGETQQAKIAGARAPALNRPMPKAWNNPQPIFNGKDLTGWEPVGNAANHWVAKDGDLLNESKGANLKTTRKFDDFKLHIEFNCPPDGNSGIFLRGRYEVQVEYEPVDANDKFHSIGAIYSMLAPSVDLPRKPGTWESFDITLVGRRVTVIRDGAKTIDNQEIPGITGGALDSDEGAPGPFFLQGDHTGGMRYRNITVQTPK